MKHNITIGYDRNNRIPAYVLAESIMQHSSVPVNFTFLHRDMLVDISRQIEQFDSTEFSNNRFLTPYLNDYCGWSLFLDNDMVVCADIKELFDMVDDKYTVMCVKHNQVCKNKKKFLDKDQHQYQYKNWSSVMLFNNSKCQNLTLDYVKTAPGFDLHQFKWTSHDSIGSLPLEWNYLVNNDNQTTNRPKLIHYTEGGPYFKETRNCDYAIVWDSVYNQINDVRR
jgi:lipopolysaccharide biosynthesis glycosyltransferase